MAESEVPKHIDTGFISEEAAAPVHMESPSQPPRSLRGEGSLSNKERVFFVFLVTAALIIPIWIIGDNVYVNSLPQGRGYSYVYSVRVTNASANFTVIVPVPATAGGGIMSGLIFELSMLGDYDIVDTVHGRGLRLRLNGSYVFAFAWYFDALRESPDRVSDGCVLLSMTEFAMDRGTICTMESGRTGGSSWLWSDSAGLEIDLEFERSWQAERTSERFFRVWRDIIDSSNNGLIEIRGQGTAANGWSECPIELDALHKVE